MSYDIANVSNDGRVTEPDPGNYIFTQSAHTPSSKPKETPNTR